MCSYVQLASMLVVWPVALQRCEGLLTRLVGRQRGRFVAGSLLAEEASDMWPGCMCLDDGCGFGQCVHGLGRGEVGKHVNAMCDMVHVV